MTKQVKSAAQRANTVRPYMCKMPRNRKSRQNHSFRQPQAAATSLGEGG